MGKFLRQITKSYQNDFYTSRHAHSEGQIVYIHNGCCIISIENYSFTVVSGQMFWIPPNLVHEAYFLQKSHLSIIYLDELKSNLFGSEPEQIRVTHLWALLINDFISRQSGMSTAELDAYNTVLLEQLSQQMPVKSNYRLDGKIDKRLLPIINHLCLQPNIKTNLDQFTYLCGASQRTLNRLFLSTFGMSFRDWRKAIVMEKAQQLSNQGHKMTDIAYELGYSSISAFSTALNKFSSD
ncbi:AraC family transcriptional regulator [Spartinivicinus poritis]|uniref:Helix-turn-helix transcriptional regulator n=1 Tax=Spartinivicinus poritis TaxID=2994640 RepID=A0ABT5UHP2_9GAMM|nr:helix-turn-helix transcriptional regulator [Spartinivicinus sp. A2-2]MDE1465904.1 helix-turn-helix transcriptional regulator [Spartinivicinus sp. A2-2]